MQRLYLLALVLTLSACAHDDGMLTDNEKDIRNAKRVCMVGALMSGTSPYFAVNLGRAMQECQ